MTSPGLSCGMWDLVPWLGIEPGPSALEACSLSHWTPGSPCNLDLKQVVAMGWETVKPTSSTKMGLAFSFRPQLSCPLFKEAPDLWQSEVACLPHMMLLYWACCHLKLAPLFDCLLPLCLFLLNLSPSKPPLTKPLLRVPVATWMCGTQRMPCALYIKGSRRMHRINRPVPQTHVFPCLLFCSLNPLIHFLFQLTQLHGCLVLGSEIPEGTHLFIILLAL